MYAFDVPARAAEAGPVWSVRRWCADHVPPDGLLVTFRLLSVAVRRQGQRAWICGSRWTRRRTS